MNTKLFTSLFICVFSLIQAQEGLPIYQDYLTGSWYLLHPSTAGAASNDQVRLTGRTQWFDVDDAPSLLTASINARASKKIGIGAIAFADRNGNFSQNGLYGTFAYHINLNARSYELNQLSFGISVAILQRRLDERGLINPRLPDPALTGGVLSNGYVNSDIGMSYYKGDLFVLGTVKNVLPINREDLLFEQGLEPQEQRTFLVTAGYTFDANQKLDIEPSVMYVTLPEIREQFADINIKGYFNFNETTQFSGGLSYRFNFDGSETTSDNQVIDLQRFSGITPFIGIKRKNYIFGYTYTNQLDDIKISSSGFHQITLGYNFYSKKNLRDGERKCNCPAFR